MLPFQKGISPSCAWCQSLDFDVYKWCTCGWVEASSLVATAVLTFPFLVKHHPLKKKSFVVAEDFSGFVKCSTFIYFVCFALYNCFYSMVVICPFVPLALLKSFLFTTQKSNQQCSDLSLCLSTNMTSMDAITHIRQQPEAGYTPCLERASWTHMQGLQA